MLLNQRLLAVTLLLMVFASVTVADDILPIFFSFDESDEVPEIWSLSDTDGPDVELGIEDGSLFLAGSEFMFSELTGSDGSSDISIRTQVKILENSNWVFFGIYGRGYWGRIRGRGEIAFGEIDVQDFADGQFVGAVRTDDVMLQLDIVGNTISMTGWPADGEKPDEPTYTVVDDTRSDGPIGIWMSTNNPSKVGFRWFEVIPIIAGDFDSNGVLDIQDIDLVATAIRDGKTNASFDLDKSGVVDANDHHVMITDIANTWFGDANLDGKFDSADLVQVFQAGEYEDGIRSNSTWATGDWNGDGEFGSADFVTAFQDGGFEQGDRPAKQVPEPCATVPLLCSILLIVHWRRRVWASAKRRAVV